MKKKKAEIVTMSEEPLALIPANKMCLRDAMAILKPFLSVDMHRQCLTGYHLSKDGVLVATDTHRLGVVGVDAEVNEDMSFAPGPYPNWAKVVSFAQPAYKADWSIEFEDAADLIEAVKGIGQFSKRESNRTTIDGTDGNLSISGGLDLRASVDIRAKIEGKPFFNINWQYLVDAVKPYVFAPGFKRSAKYPVRMEGRGSNSPVTLTIGGVTPYYAILMPMAMDNYVPKEAPNA